MFELIVSGSGSTRTKMMKKMSEKGKTKFDIYKALKKSYGDESEQRMSLWLPLTTEEKADMILNQRIPEEMEMMLLMLDHEMDGSILSTKSLFESNQLGIMVERALDMQVYDKYIKLARL